MTGDTVVNADAPLVVMTTEVLRNMIYASSPALADLRTVVLDEVHFLQDAYRGPVWEEVIIQAPPDARLVCLSATASNAGELAEWITAVRTTTEAVVETERPVELVSHFVVGDRNRGGLRSFPPAARDRANPDIVRLVAASHRRGGHSKRSRLYRPRRLEMLDLLEEADHLPSIWFVFSRQGCDDAAKHLVASGVRLSTAPDADRIAAIAEEAIGELDESERTALGFDTWVEIWKAGVAAHHAGLVPAFKECVERCFNAGLIKVVFATETLALGINMPARSVVIESLSRFKGEGHVALTPGDYAQLTGRAGRRGIDERGHAYTQWSRFVEVERLAALVTSTDFELRSAFRPTYNMVANLVAARGLSGAEHLVRQSFAQFQQTKQTERLRARLSRERARLTPESPEDAAEAPIDEADMRAALAALSPGDLIEDPAHRNRRLAVVSVAERRNGVVRVRTVSSAGAVQTLDGTTIVDPPAPIGSIELPEPYRPNHRGFQREVAKRARAVHLSARPARPAKRQPTAAQAARRSSRAAREVRSLEEQLAHQSDELGHRLSSTMAVLTELGHFVGEQPTAGGELLARIYHESDVLITEALVAGVLDNLDEAQIAATVCTITYEHRSPEPQPRPWYPDATVRRAVGTLDDITRRINSIEARHALAATRSPDPTFVPFVHGWVLGVPLDDLLADSEVAAGDFVRILRQLIDLLRQIAKVGPSSTVRAAARSASRRCDRGLVAASARVGV